MSTLSVVLPNYNRAEHLSTALRALLAQDRPAEEIVVVDDGSTDQSLAVIEQFASCNAALRVVVSPRNEGVIAALNRGLASVVGEYVYFAASDDWVLPGFFSAALERLELDDEIGLFCGEVQLLDAGTGEATGMRPVVRPIQGGGVAPPAAVARLLRRSDNWIVTGGAVFRRDHLTWAGAFDERLGSFADGFVARKIALRFGFFFEPRVVATWTISRDSVSRRTALDPTAAVAALASLPAAIASDPAFPSWYPDLFRDRWRFATSRLAFEADPINLPLVEAMGVQSPIDRAVLTWLCPRLTHRLAKSVGLAWLWLRLQPTTLRGLIRTSAARRLAP